MWLFETKFEIINVEFENIIMIRKHIQELNNFFSQIQQLLFGLMLTTTKEHK